MIVKMDHICFARFFFQVSETGVSRNSGFAKNVPKIGRNGTGVEKSFKVITTGVVSG